MRKLDNVRIAALEERAGLELQGGSWLAAFGAVTLGGIAWAVTRNHYVGLSVTVGVEGIAETMHLHHYHEFQKEIEEEREQARRRYKDCKEKCLLEHPESAIEWVKDEVK